MLCILPIDPVSSYAQGAYGWLLFVEKCGFYTMKRQDVLIHTVSGTSAAAFATILLYPIDSIKTRMQAQDGTAARQLNDVTRYRSPRHALRAVYETEGVSCPVPGYDSCGCRWRNRLGSVLRGIQLGMSGS